MYTHTIEYIREIYARDMSKSQSAMLLQLMCNLDSIEEAIRAKTLSPIQLALSIGGILGIQRLSGNLTEEKFRELCYLDQEENETYAQEYYRNL